MNPTLEHVEIDAGASPQVMAGDYVRSFDFPESSRELSGERACYVEGLVEGIIDYEGCPRYHIEVERIIRMGEDKTGDGPAEVLPPVNGTMRLFGGTCDGVELVHRNGWYPVIDMGSWAKMMEGQTLMLCPMGLDGAVQDSEARVIDWEVLSDTERQQMNALAAMLGRVWL
jgi:hypothetical protein